MARVASHTSIPIASGERLVTKYEFAQLIEKKAAQIIQIDVGQAGGILESTKVDGISSGVGSKNGREKSWPIPAWKTMIRS